MLWFLKNMKSVYTDWLMDMLKIIIFFINGNLTYSWILLYFILWERNMVDVFRKMKQYGVLLINSIIILLIIGKKNWSIPLFLLFRECVSTLTKSQVI